MLHLFPAKRKTKEVHEHLIHDEHNRFRFGKKRFPKAFPLTAFVDLVEKPPNPRDRMLWLLLFGLGLRQSEPLHIYLEDCRGTTEFGKTKVMLDDPEIGEFQWCDGSGSERQGTRRVCHSVTDPFNSTWDYRQERKKSFTRKPLIDWPEKVDHNRSSEPDPLNLCE